MRTREITRELELQALLKMRTDVYTWQSSYHQLSHIMSQLAHLYRSVSLGNSINHLKHCLARAICEIKHSARGLGANKALGFASCFISRIALTAML